MHCVSSLVTSLRASLVAICAALPLMGFAQAPGAVKLGVIGPFTGASSDFGKPLLQGIQLANPRRYWFSGVVPCPPLALRFPF